MPDLRSEEQKDSIKALESAIERVNNAYHEQGTLVEWVVIESRRLFDEEGSAAGIGLIFSDELPVHHRAGLLLAAMDQTSEQMRSG